MKRIYCIILCLCIVFPMVVAFSGCAKSVTVDLSEYRLVYPKEYLAAFKNKIREFASLIDEKTDKYPDVVADTTTEQEYEILIGDTARTESIDILSKIKGDGYAIAVEGNKIVIVGTNDMFTMKALQAFSDTYLSTEGVDAKAVSIKTKNIVSNAPTVILDSSFSIVYSENLDDDRGSSYGSNSNYLPENPDRYDYPVVAAYALAKGLQKLWSGENNVCSDKSYETFEKCILIGMTACDLSNSLIKNLDSNVYGFQIKGNTIAVSGSTDAGIEDATILFKNILESCLFVDEAGNSAAKLPADISWYATSNASWFTDFPRPTGDGIEYGGSQDVADGSVLYYYTGNGVNAEAYRAYYNILKSAGYTVYTENKIGNNCFATFVNSEKQSTLQVTYAAYEYATGQDAKSYSPCIRIVSANLTSVNLPDLNILDPLQTYTKLTESKITSVNLDSPYGNSYVITLEDGSFIVYDGGSYEDPDDGDLLYSVLCDLHTSIKGTKPSPSSPIVIAAWMLSHGHGDHFVGFNNMLKAYGKNIYIEQAFFNGTSDEEDFNSHNPNSTVRDGIGAILSRAQGNAKCVKVHTGQVFYVRNVEIEVLYTHEDLYPIRSDFFNDGSTVFRTTIYSTDGRGNRLNEGVSTMWLGDMYMRGSKCMRMMYGNYLQSDAVQVAHHGFQGCEWPLYQLIAPECVLWPISLTRFIEVTSNATGAYYLTTNYKICNNLASVKMIIVADTYHTTITVTEDGFDYRLQKDSPTGLYNAGTGANGKPNNELRPIASYGGALLPIS